MTARGGLRELSACTRPARPDLLVHALSQLPDLVTLRLPAEEPERDRLAVLAQAYGIHDRIHFESGVPATGSGFRPVAEIVADAMEPGDPPASLRTQDEPFAGQRVVLITNIPAHYRVPLFNAMSQRLAAAGAALHVLFLSPGSQRRFWMNAAEDSAFDHQFLHGARLPGSAERRAAVPMDLERRLRGLRPTLVLSGGLSPAVSGRAALYSRARGIPFGFWSGELPWSPTAGSRLRHASRVWLARMSDYAIAYGCGAAEYVRSLRAELPTVIARNSAPVGGTLRQLPDRPGPVELLTVGDLESSNKRVDVLIDALREVPHLSCRLTIVGGGAFQDALRDRARGDERVRFLGAVHPERVRECYEASEVFLFASERDVFGLSLLEAMGAGLACVTSTAAGAVLDLASSGRTCLVVDRLDPSPWAGAIERLVNDHALRRSLGSWGRAFVEGRWTLEHACDAMIAGLRLGLIRRTTPLAARTAQLRLGSRASRALASGGT